MQIHITEERKQTRYAVHAHISFYYRVNIEIPMEYVLYKCFSMNSIEKIYPQTPRYVVVTTQK